MYTCKYECVSLGEKNRGKRGLGGEKSFFDRLDSQRRSPFKYGI